MYTSASIIGLVEGCLQNDSCQIISQEEGLTRTRVFILYFSYSPNSCWMLLGFWFWLLLSVSSYGIEHGSNISGSPNLQRHFSHQEVLSCSRDIPRRGLVIGAMLQRKRSDLSPWNRALGHEVAAKTCFSTRTSFKTLISLCTHSCTKVDSRYSDVQEEWPKKKKQLIHWCVAQR